MKYMDKELNNFLQDESEDAILARIQEESLRYYNEVELPRRAAEQKQEKEEKRCNTEESFVFEPLPHCSKQTKYSDASPTPIPAREVFYKALREGADGFHLAAGETYVYPTNYPVRQYQKTIIHSALFHNTLVSLPTGLGKTFIAAVVMYNYYRWFPQGKIVFMAPTRPLVAQQIRACHDIMAIPIKDTIEMTGTMNPTDRIQHWKNKRVFFLTPQVMANDLRTKACPASAFKCVVIDEAHRATKEYSYCHVIKELENAGAIFRVLALSATPGSNIKAVIEVVQNLRISVLELRGEDSPDVVPYTHTKQVEPVSLSLPKSIIEFREQFLLIFERYARSLRDARLLTCNVQNLSKFQLLKACEKIRSRPPNGINKARLGIIMSDFGVCMTLAHGLELLQTYGLRAFYQYFTACEEEENRKAAFTRLNNDADFHCFMNKLQQAVSSPMDQFWSHPKHERLVKILKEHFCHAEKEGSDTKVIIFCQYRVVVSELYELLQKAHPLIKPVMFIGQGVGKDRSGLPQKKQIEVMKGFREGRSNVLIATCVAEEGLDIGAVDLLVLMECQRSPVRLVQRLGRTGRHRKGHCVVLLTQGREVQKFNEAMATRKSFLSMIQKSKVLSANLYKDEPTMVPPNIMPRIQFVHINVPERITPGKKKKSKQSDIRQALISKLSDTEDKKPEESPFLNPEQLSLVKEELNTLRVKYDSIRCTEPEYIFNRMKGAPMQPDELFSPAFTQHSEFNDWNRALHQTYLLLHSSDTETFCHLLHKSESMSLNIHEDLNSQQINCSNLFPSKKDVKKNKAKFDNGVKKKKNDKEERHGRDIRECMAQAADKIRLTQNKQMENDKDTEENNHPEENKHWEEESVEMIPDPVISEISETIPDDLCKDVKNLSNSQIKELNCPFCNENGTFLQYKLIKKPDTDLLDINLNSLKTFETFVQNLTKDSVANIHITQLFGSGSSHPMNNIRKNVLQLKNSLNFSIKQKDNSPLISVDDIFDEDSNSPQKSIEDLNISSRPKECMKEETYKVTPTNSKNIEEQEFFNLEDIFNEDDGLSFNTLGENTKTSTPVKENSSSSVPLHTPVLSISNKSDNDLIRNGILNITGKNLFRNYETIPTSKLNSKCEKAIFKLPQMKLNFKTLPSPKPITSPNSIKQPRSPGSPILSGQVTSSQDAILSPVLSGQIVSNQDSILSPIFTSQMTTKQDKMSPILSGKVTSTPKLEGKVLFPDNPLGTKDVFESSNLCKPLSGVTKHSETDMAEIEALQLLSASQLFDSSSDEDNKDNLDESSMYTITQMVAKVSDLANKNKASEPQTQRVPLESVNVEQSKSKIHFASSDEDSVFGEINLDNFSSLENNMSSSKQNSIIRSGIKASFFNSSSKIKSLNSDDSIIEKDEIDKINWLKRSSKMDRSSLCGDKITKLVTEPTQKNDSFISSRWLSCMKTPLKSKKCVSFTADSINKFSDSNSDNDVFENPLQTNKTRAVKVKSKAKAVNGKSSKQAAKPRFLELEADVSMNGIVCSSDEENTSGLDEMDESFINDLTELPSTSVDQTALDIQAKYLQSVKSPIKRPGYKIPKMTDEILGMDVFSQAVPEDDDSYENDSFCCDATEIPVEDEPSVLEIAEQLLKMKSRKEKNKKRKRHKSDYTSGDERDNEIKKKRLLSSSSSNEDDSICAKKTDKRKHLSSSDSSPIKLNGKRVLKKKRRIQLLTSSDSDSDKTIL